MSLYTLRSTPRGYAITKFDLSLNPEISYEVSELACTCPAGVRPTCRHRQMLPLMKDRVDTGWFWDHENSHWVEPINDGILPAGPPQDTAELVPEGPSQAALFLDLNAGEEPEPSTLAADRSSSPSQDQSSGVASVTGPDLRGEPAPEKIRRRI